MNVASYKAIERQISVLIVVRVKKNNIEEKQNLLSSSQEENDIYTSKSLPCVFTLHHLAMGSGTTSQSLLSCSKSRTNVDLPAAENKE